AAFRAKQRSCLDYRFSSKAAEQSSLPLREHPARDRKRRARLCGAPGAVHGRNPAAVVAGDCWRVVGLRGIGVTGDVCAVSDPLVGKARGGAVKKGAEQSRRPGAGRAGEPLLEVVEVGDGGAEVRPWEGPLGENELPSDRWRHGSERRPEEGEAGG